MTDMEAREKIELIETTLMKESVLGFNPAILALLDNIESGRRDIENMKSHLGPDVFNYLFSLADSAYHGSMKAGTVKHFFDVVNRLGMQYVKVQILLFTLKRSARGDDDAELLFARNIAASILGRILARGFGFRDDAARQVELGCLLSRIGALMMIIYRNNFTSPDVAVTDAFIEDHHMELTERIIERFQLPDYLRDMVLTDYFILERRGISLSAIVNLAVCFVECSFKKFANKLVIRCPLPSDEDLSAPSLGKIMEEQFAAAGFRRYIEIVTEAPRTEL